MNKTEEDTFKIDGITVINTFMDGIDKDDIMHNVIAETMADFILRVFAHAEIEHTKKDLTLSVLMKIASKQLIGISDKLDRNRKILIDKSWKEERAFQNSILS